MRKIEATLKGILTCLDGHSHGAAKVHLVAEHPFEIRIEVECARIGSPVVGITDRETLARCAAWGDVDFDVCGTPGAVTFRILQEIPSLILIAIPAANLNSTAIFAVQRDDVVEFVTDVYDEVPAGCENVGDLDQLAARLLYS